MKKESYGILGIILLLLLAGCSQRDLAGEAYKEEAGEAYKSKEDGTSKELMYLLNDVGVNDLNKLYNQYNIKKGRGECDLGQV